MLPDPGPYYFKFDQKEYDSFIQFREQEIKAHDDLRIAQPLGFNIEYVPVREEKLIIGRIVKSIEDFFLPNGSLHKSSKSKLTIKPLIKKLIKPQKQIKRIDMHCIYNLSFPFSYDIAVKNILRDFDKKIPTLALCLTDSTLKDLPIYIRIYILKLNRFLYSFPDSKNFQIEMHNRMKQQGMIDKAQTYKEFWNYKEAVSYMSSSEGIKTKSFFTKNK